MVFTDHFQLEGLTGCSSLHTNVHKNAMAIRLARAFGAFKIAVKKLRNHYENLNSRNTHERQAERKLGVTFPYPDSCETESGRIEFTYDFHFTNVKLIFVATATERTKDLFKFTRRYSEEAHHSVLRLG